MPSTKDQAQECIEDTWRSAWRPADVKSSAMAENELVVVVVKYKWLKTKQKARKKETKEKLKQVIKNQTKGKKRSLEWERSRSLRQG
jgi:hypothetical protein